MARLVVINEHFLPIKEPSETSGRWHAAHLPSTCARLVGSEHTMHIAARYPANDRPIIDRRAGISSLQDFRKSRLLGRGTCVYRSPPAKATAGHNLATILSFSLSLSRGDWRRSDRGREVTVLSVQTTIWKCSMEKSIAETRLLARWHL